MSKNSCLSSYSELLHSNRQDFLDIPKRLSFFVNSTYFNNTEKIYTFCDLFQEMSSIIKINECALRSQSGPRLYPPLTTKLNRVYAPG